MALGLASLGGCSSVRPAVAPAVAPAKLRHFALSSRAASSLASRPALANELASSVHRYFRFINEPFAQRTCGLLARAGHTGPQVNLHGDAHVEQYAVSQEERGLADFDAATTGPLGVDLLRFAVSLRLVARERGWERARDELVAAFLASYAEALEQPEIELPEPRVAARLRRASDASPELWLERTTSLMEPLAPEAHERLRAAKGSYRLRMLQQNPALTPTFFELKRAGGLEMGIGSAFEQKYLLRVEGPTPRGDDDVILEMKEMSDLSSVPCLSGASAQDPFRVIVAQSRIGSAPSDLLGYAESEGTTFYVQKWRVGYTEVRAHHLVDPEEMVEIARDVGQQLGRGHPRSIAAPHDVQLRVALREHVRERRQVLSAAAAQLEAEVVLGWRGFGGQEDLNGL